MSSVALALLESPSRSNDRAKDDPTLPRFCLDVLGVLALAGLLELLIALEDCNDRARGEGVVALEGIVAAWLVVVSRRSAVVLGDKDDNSVGVAASGAVFFSGDE